MSKRTLHLRRVLAPLAAAATALSLMAGAAPAQAAVGARVSVAASPATTLPHDVVSIAGTVSPRGSGVAVLQHWSAGHWVQVAHKTTPASGAYSFAVRASSAPGTMIYRVTRAASTAAKALTSKTVHIVVTKSVFKLKASSPAAVGDGSPVVVTGTVANHAKGFVLLEVLQHGAWKDLYTGKLTSASTFSFSHVMPAGTYALRVRKPYTSTVASGVSPTVKVTVASPPAAPTAAVALSGTVVSTGVFSGTVTATAVTTAAAGFASVTYVLDGATAKPYTAPLSITGAGSHTVAFTVTDTRGRTATASVTLTITTAAGTPAPPVGPGGGNPSQPGVPDTTPPVATITLAGAVESPNVYSGPVGVTVSATDAGGVASVSYAVDGGSATLAPAGSASVTFGITGLGSHTVTASATDNSGNRGTATPATFTEQASSGNANLVISSDDQGTLGLPRARLVFSTYRGDPRPLTDKSFTFTNNGTATLQVSGLTVTGTDPGNFALANGQPTTLTIGPGSSAPVTIGFTPTQPTGCASGAVGTPTDLLIGDADRSATLSFTTTDSGHSTGTVDLSGITACGAGGNNEPVLDQVLAGLGYTDKVDNGYDDRYIGPTRYFGGTDEIETPYFTAANPLMQVSFAPIAHYGAPNNTAGGFQSTGWYAQGASMTANSTCSAACNTLWKFADDTINGNTYTYNQNQKLLPSVMGVTTFTPTGPFGVFSSDFSEVNFSDDALNVANSTSNVPLPAGSSHYLHNLRIYPALGPNRVPIANAYIVADDLSRVPSYKNNDYQDVVFLLSNVQPATAETTLPSSNPVSLDLTSGGTVDANCTPSGFSGVLASSGPNCVPGNISFGGSGLQITSTAGQLANGNQQDAPYHTFDATQTAFTIDAKVTGGLDQLNADYQQIGAFFGPDQNNFIKIEVEHNGANSPHLTMYYRDKDVNGGNGASVMTVTPAGLAGATTLDLIIKGNASLPDPIPYGAGDTYGVHGYPLDQLSVWYSINGGTPQQVGTVDEYPAAVSTWFSRAAKAGILDSNSGAASSLTATFSHFSITAG